jgi:hypothetical protein
MNLRYVATIGLSLISIGCSMTLRMVPVDGPLSQARPLPTIDVRVNGIQGNSGTLAFVMPDGERCEGRWVSLRASATVASSDTLLSRYGPMYLSGVSVAQLGQNPGQALASCAQGRIVQIEFVTNNGSAHGVGIAKDSDNNVFRMVF